MKFFVIQFDKYNCDGLGVLCGDFAIVNTFDWRKQNFFLGQMAFFSVFQVELVFF